MLSQHNPICIASMEIGASINFCDTCRASSCATCVSMPSSLSVLFKALLIKKSSYVGSGYSTCNEWKKKWFMASLSVVGRGGTLGEQGCCPRSTTS